ncbi:hypothetical protein [Pseudonocardia thermophila]|uniref:hypothetical protein n=1 Tax=Pseudonocardia thermophila TaxID=1848 RepID=UPI0011610FB5|nr:hypothetical protein [Pseudonocardia thermophila]
MAGQQLSPARNGGEESSAGAIHLNTPGLTPWTVPPPLTERHREATAALAVVDTEAHEPALCSFAAEPDHHSGFPDRTVAFPDQHCSS